MNENTKQLATRLNILNGVLAAVVVIFNLRVLTSPDPTGERAWLLASSIIGIVLVATNVVSAALATTKQRTNSHWSMATMWFVYTIINVAAVMYTGGVLHS